MSLASHQLLLVNSNINAMRSLIDTLDVVGAHIAGTAAGLDELERVVDRGDDWLELLGSVFQDGLVEFEEDDAVREYMTLVNDLVVKTDAVRSDFIKLHLKIKTLI